MNRPTFAIVFGLGAAAVLWIAGGFLMSMHMVALAMTLLIAAVYGSGALELHRFRQVTATLTQALANIAPPVHNLDAWLGSIHPQLQSAVRLRIEGERSGLPGPAFTPYLVGLLVMLGMLGTFLGMVVTLNGAVFALEGTTDIAAIRSAFAAPIKGLGLSFGTSVAGVASSAMLGLMSAISRRERILAAQVLDNKIASDLHRFSLSYQRQETLKALQAQSQALQAQSQVLPTVVDQMQALMVRMENVAKEVYTGLAQSVDQSLRTSLMQSTTAASDALRPVVETAMSALSQEARSLHERMVHTTQTQLETLTQRLDANASQTGAAWADSLNAMASSFSHSLQSNSEHVLAQQQAVCNSLEATAQSIACEAQTNTGKTLAALDRLVTNAEALASARATTEAAATAQHAERMAALTTRMQADLTSHLTTLGASLEAPIARLIHTAAEAPRAAAEVIGKLREEVSNSAARDNDLLQERSRILATLNTLLDGITHASTEQRAVIDTLVQSADQSLLAASQHFATQVDTKAESLAGIADQVSTSAIEVATLGDTLGFAVRSFSEANDKMISSLQRIEAAMDKSMARSDDQLAYYVAQAREVIDLSITSQKDIVEELRQLATHQVSLQIETA